MVQKNAHFLRLVGSILGAAAAISLIVLGLGSFFHWNGPVQYSNGFFTAGAILIVLGAFSVAGGFMQRADFKMTYAESAGQANLAERSQRIAADITQRYGTMIFLIVTGLLMILVAVGIGSLLVVY